VFALFVFTRVMECMYGCVVIRYHWAAYRI